ncbi:Putative reductase [Candidatus Xiphinematobacter sp. Idaho Grape]|uniref:enoyl-ACP reductase FabV n=1 Tax=Candidatus Xiphinematobacter sp. Idaho Grape TaxID=1704307 RepID=UPI0007061BFA|nr:enoyl-ACP reductase FabV [Candidatus Xiphinematobacter sp. Idaho Grape]ALJ56862.1 Putative reductase [Candidatus Xiphinematobacter sp. Idaho Grape]
MFIKPRIRSFVCTTAHPDGCVAHVRQQMRYVMSKPLLPSAPQRVLVIGASSGYGLASRIVAAFGGRASTVGVFFEREGTKKKLASAGWYNSAAFEAAAIKEGLYAKSFNGDAFSEEMKKRVTSIIRRDLGQIDLIVYSVASPRRLDPARGKIYKSTLKPIGSSLVTKSICTDKKEIESVTLEAATWEEVFHTIKVMGGEDWKIWISSMADAGALSEGFRTVAYSYLGPGLTRAIYAQGTIGRAKIDLERTARELNKQFGDRTAFISINKAVVTQASSAIPAVPLYISILFKVMKERGIHEGCIEQMYRLFRDHLCSPRGPRLDTEGRIRLDDLEMREDIQTEVTKIWRAITTDTIDKLSDFKGYQKEFYHLFGFGFPEVDYSKEINPVHYLPDPT